jgi:hypothetical protein
VIILCGHYATKFHHTWCSLIQNRKPSLTCIQIERGFIYRRCIGATERLHCSVAASLRPASERASGVMSWAVARHAPNDYCHRQCHVWSVVKQRQITLHEAIHPTGTRYTHNQKWTNQRLNALRDFLFCGPKISDDKRINFEFWHCRFMHLEIVLKCVVWNAREGAKCQVCVKINWLRSSAHLVLC